MPSIQTRLRRAATPLAVSMLFATSAQAQMLIGWAQMPAATFSDGPTSGQFTGVNPFGTNVPPYVGKQPVQGFSGVLDGPRKDVFQVAPEPAVRMRVLALTNESQDGRTVNAAVLGNATQGLAASIGLDRQLALSKHGALLFGQCQVIESRPF